ncbi:uncharacterized protein DEA37_0010111 [Paragonimus westermani]|uniref:Uncharacterized protein n=1 Tax=Paragonimus westermani TaxID=34504 RepID=A0A5J4P3G5_9TREM|nr:uncharacterized protein DEA37_0010111 [Paragonimus westermani]
MLRSRKNSLQQSKLKDAQNSKEEVSANSVESSSTASDIGWVGPITLRKRAKPELENDRYRDVSLRLSVQEVKNLATKRKYFCEVCLDRTLYARTTSKQSDGTVFWGEKFELNNLPELSILTINLYRQGPGSNKDKRQRNKAYNQFVAFVTLPLTDLPSTSEYQQWLPMQAPQTTPYLTNLENWQSTGLTRGGDTSISPKASNNSPNGTHFRKRSTPVGCFRHSTSTSTFASPNESVNEAVPETRGKKKRSWTAGIATTSDTSSNHRCGVTSPNSIAASANVSPNYQSSRTSLTLSETSLPQIRLNVQYESIDILPLDYYGELREFLKTRSLTLIRFLEPHLSAKQKEKLASCFVNVHEKLPDFSIPDFLCGMLQEDIKQTPNEAMLLRSNSIASKSVECYIKLVGSEYLHQLLKGFIDQLLNSADDFEIDPSRLKSAESGSNPLENTVNSQIETNRQALLKSVTLLWRRIVASQNCVPYELREAFCSLNSLLEKTYGSRMAMQVISSCLFLRFICPAIHGPVLFGLTNSVPENSRVSRNLTLLAKVLQNLANMSKFEEKEVHMKVLNMFVEREIPVMQAFLRNVASLDETFEEDAEYEDCHNFIDLGYEYAKLSSLLLGYLRELQLPPELSQLTGILNFIHEHTTDEVLSSWAPDVVACRRYASCDSTGQTRQPQCRPRLYSTDHIYGGSQRSGSETGKRSTESCAPSLGRKISDDTFEKNNHDRISIAGSSQFVEQSMQRRQDDRNEYNYQPSDRYDVVKSHCTPKPLEIPQVEEVELSAVANMDELVVHYREQMRQLNACIDRVENISLESGTSTERGRSQAFLNGAVQPEDGRSLSGCSSHNGNWRANPTPGLANYLQSEVGYKQDISDYEFNDEDQPSDAQNHQCQSEPLEIQLSGTGRIDEVPPGQSILSESPSLDQLAERLQELKRLLKRERQELAQVVATKARAIQAQEQSIEQLSCELNQLRRTPAARLRAPCELSSNKHTPGTNSPSSSLSSECFVSNRSDETTHQPCSEMKVTGEPTGFVHRKSESCGQQRVSPYMNNQRSHSFRSNPDQNGPDNPQVRYGPNLLDLSRASEGTGIPLGALITPNNPVPVRRRFSETKTIYH